MIRSPAAAAAALASTLIFLPVPLPAQEVAMDAGHLAHAVDRLVVTGRVLYVAAHPDDENTRLLGYLANARHLTVAYLSMTRGGGGQNLVGREQAELLDVIRTQELLSARRLDGAVQRFTRMRDFGYSKSAKETLETWGHDEALSDVVWVLRTFQPDVVITRFDEKPPNHGQHTASAILAREAFAAAADPKRFPEQLTRGASTWQPARLLLNVPMWRDEPPPPNAIAMDVGAYDPRLGLSYGELAALSRSRHQSQGFGVSGERGTVIERFVTLAGTPATGDPLEGIPFGWERFGEAGTAFAASIERARGLLDRDRPEAALPALLAAGKALARLPDAPRVRDARRSLEAVSAAAVGLFVRATSPRPAAVPGGSADVDVEVVLRRPATMKLTRLSFPGGPATAPALSLSVNEKKVFKQQVPIPPEARVSVPYWLAEPSSNGVEGVTDLGMIGEAEDPAPLRVSAVFEAQGGELRIDVPVQYAWTDPVRGERVRQVLIAPPATVTPVREAAMAVNGRAAPVVLRIRAARDTVSGRVVLPVPDGWRVDPASVPVELQKAGDESTVRFAVTPPAGAAPTLLRPAIEVGARSWGLREDVIDYGHIPLQVVLQPARLKVAPLSVETPPGLVGYVEGSGDTVADDLAHIGLDVEVLDDEALVSGDLARFRAIVIGIRAYNTRAALRAQHDRLMRYVEEGGTVVVQYNTQSRLGPLDGRVGPYPLEIGRGRVTDQRAAMTVLAKDHEIVTRPHRIAPSDFEGWVQERGLYFASTWDPKYTPIFAAADPDESPLEGGLLFARHGRGRYVFTGLAFFRQLPAGVPGAYRLFVNLLGSAP
jgi:LmbE family N-acetylglucosaminyl deacetylase